MTHLNLADKGTKFFHSLVKRHHRESFIASMNGHDGNPTSSANEVISEFVDYFTNLIGHAPDICEPIDPTVLLYDRTLTHDEASPLCRPVTIAGIKGARFSIEKYKAPGPDGVSSEFFISS